MKLNIGEVITYCSLLLLIAIVLDFIDGREATLVLRALREGA
jgi:phosphatidylserine synthase